MIVAINLKVSNSPNGCVAQLVECLSNMCKARVQSQHCMKQGVETQAYNPSTQEVESGKGKRPSSAGYLLS